MKVIVADDSMLTRKIVIKFIASLGVEPIEAGNGKEVIDIIRQTHEMPHLILMDWNMPELDGLEVLKWIQKDARLKAIPVIMLTSESDEISMNTAMTAGARAYISKPFTEDELVDTIRKTIG